MQLLLETFGEALMEKIPFFGALIGYVEKYKNKIDAARLAVFLEKMKGKMESHDAFVNALGKLLISNAGLTLFQKTLRILNKDNFDSDFTDLLATTLKNISDADFDEMFEELNYVLSQIERLSPHALLVLSKNPSWNKAPLSGGTTTSGQTLLGDWDTQVTNFYSRNLNITDERKKKRIAHAFRELQSGGVLFVNENKRVQLTSTGEEVYKVICS